MNSSHILKKIAYVWTQLLKTYCYVFQGNDDYEPALAKSEMPKPIFDFGNQDDDSVAESGGKFDYQVCV